MTITNWIHGPIISSSDIERHRALFAAFGMAEIARRTLDEAASAAAWGVHGRTAVELVMQTPGTRYGARILAFDPPSGTVIRSPESGYDADALKVIDFYVPDFDAARQSIEDAGFALADTIAEYSLPEGQFREGHIWGPDGVVCALITGPADFFTRFATLTDRLFSEPQSISGPVSDRPASLRFFKDVFDIGEINRYGIADDSFRDLVGTDEAQFNLSAINVGVRTEEPYFGLIDYGMPKGSYRSLFACSVLPNLGLIGATVIVSDVSSVEARARQAGADILAGLHEGDIPGCGSGRMLLLRAPNGGAYQAIELY